MTTVAVMQPYFVPYAGYFRLFAAADVVVMFDCVQFPRRGWVHRNRFPVASGEVDWLTLPIGKAPFDAQIADLRFQEDAAERLTAAMRKFPILARALAERHPAVARVLSLGGSSVAEYLVDLVGYVSRELHLEKQIVRSSSLGIPADLRGEERVLAIVERLGAERYINPSGGRELYNAATFKSRGVDLCFLTPFAGNATSILARMLTERRESVAAEIVEQTVVEP